MNIIFDLDGTLFKTETVDIEAFNHALCDFGFAPKSGKCILDLIGSPMGRLSRILLGPVSKKELKRFEELVIHYELDLIVKKGELYPKVCAMLDSLKSKGYSLFICSNGTKEYVESIVSKYSLEEYFKRVWYKKYGISKSRAVRQLIGKNSTGMSILVGDRQSDFIAARKNGCTFVWAGYGFGNEGEVIGTDYIARTVGDLPEIIKMIGEVG